MKDFFKFMFASMLGLVITLIIAFFLLMAMIASFISMAEQQTVEVEPGTILHIKLDYAVTDRTLKEINPFMTADFSFEQKPGLNDILKNIDKASKDDRIEGIYLDLMMIPAGISTIEEIRGALEDFKASGKFVICYTEGMAQTSYYLGSVADKFYMHPDGMIEFKGLGAEIFFLKGTMEKLGIDIQVMREGKYKSAIEPLIFDKMSEANREQIQRYIDRTWEEMITKIAESRGLPVEELNKIADNLDALNPDKALEMKLVDGLYHKDELLGEFRSLTGLGNDDDIKYVSLPKYLHASDPGRERVTTRDRIAIVYALGSIQSGKGDDQTIGSDRISKAIRQARENERVKAIVMRVNSPGGSAIASEVIRREVELAKKEKPVIVSMGGVAASGGYWIAASADKIIADPTTITGSIGVFGIIPNMQEFFNEKLGITFDYANTNENADFPPVSKPMSSYQKMVLEREIGNIYDDFLELVAEGRGMTKEEVHEIAQGRVWNAVDAKNAGLIDELGGMNDAIKMAAEMAELEEYKFLELPYQKDPFEQIIEDLTGQVRTGMIRQELGDFYNYYEYVNEIRHMEGIQARMPFHIEIK
jgi:protease-4